MKNRNRKKAIEILAAAVISLTLAACSEAKAETKETIPAITAAAAVKAEDSGTVEPVSAVMTEGAAIDSSDLFTSRDLEQTADLSGASEIAVKSGESISITSEGVYVLSGSGENVTITVDAEDAKVQLVLNGVSITNTDMPAIYIKSADKTFITLAEGSENTLSVTGSFAEDESTGLDAVIFSKDDLTVNGTGSLLISSSDNGITSKDDLKITGGTVTVNASDHALEANDSIRIVNGALNLSAGKDGLHAGDDDDDTKGFIYIGSGTLNINAADDAIHAVTIIEVDNGSLTMKGHEGMEATWVQINGGTIAITAEDDGINATRTSSSYAAAAEINGGEVTISMASGDTDGIDSNGNLVITGGKIDITGPSAFDFDGTVTFTGGTVIVNGTEQTQITGSMMGGRGMKNQGGFRRG